MAKVTLVLTGDANLNAKLARLKHTDAKKAVRFAARRAVKPVQRAAKRLAPVGKTRTLSRSIKVRSLKRSRSRTGVRVTTGKADNAFTGKAFYGGFVEFGWTHRGRAGRKSDKPGRKIPGQHFMKRAADSKRRTALTIYRHIIRQKITEFAQKGGRK